MAYGNWEIKESNRGLFGRRKTKTILYNDSYAFTSLDSVNESSESEYEIDIINQINELNFEEA